jgi:hypothetical protein
MEATIKGRILFTSSTRLRIRARRRKAIVEVEVIRASRAIIWLGRTSLLRRFRYLPTKRIALHRCSTDSFNSSSDLLSSLQLVMINSSSNTRQATAMADRKQSSIPWTIATRWSRTTSTHSRTCRQQPRSIRITMHSSCKARRTSKCLRSRRYSRCTNLLLGTTTQRNRGSLINHLQRLPSSSILRRRGRASIALRDLRLRTMGITLI